MVAQTGDLKISTEIRELFGTKFLYIDTNFNPLKYKGFSDVLLREITQIRICVGVQMTDRNSGKMTFILQNSKNLNLDNNIKNVFINYFV